MGQFGRRFLPDQVHQTWPKESASRRLHLRMSCLKHGRGSFKAESCPTFHTVSSVPSLLLAIAYPGSTGWHFGRTGSVILVMTWTAVALRWHKIQVRNGSSKLTRTCHEHDQVSLMKRNALC